MKGLLEHNVTLSTKKKKKQYNKEKNLVVIVPCWCSCGSLCGAEVKCFVCVQFIRALGRVVGGPTDRETAHLGTGTRTEGSRRGAGEGAAPRVVLPQGERSTETEKVQKKQPNIINLIHSPLQKYWNSKAVRV